MSNANLSTKDFVNKDFVNKSTPLKGFAGASRRFKHLKEDLMIAKELFTEDNFLI